MNYVLKVARPLTAALIVSTAYGFAPAPAPEPDRISMSTAISGGSFLGIGVTEITPERAKALNLREERGVEITRVEEVSPAARAGLKTADVVLEYGGQRVEGTEQFVRLVRETPVGREVKVSISRNGSMQTVVAKTATRRNDMSRTWTLHAGDPFPVNAPEFRLHELPRAPLGMHSPSIGIEAEAVDSQLAQYFGVKEGVLVRSVLKGSAAEKSGIRAGDVITRIDSTAVLNLREIASALRAAWSKKTVAVSLTRDRHEMSIPVSLDDDRPNGGLLPVHPRPAPLRNFSLPWMLDAPSAGGRPRYGAS